jgi:hypothetical protein
VVLEQEWRQPPVEVEDSVTEEVALALQLNSIAVVGDDKVVHDTRNELRRSERSGERSGCEIGEGEEGTTKEWTTTDCHHHHHHYHTTTTITTTTTTTTNNTTNINNNTTAPSLPAE